MIIYPNNILGIGITCSWFEARDQGIYLKIPAQCPFCGDSISTQFFGRNWFTIFNIPIFPLSTYSGIKNCICKKNFRVKLNRSDSEYIKGIAARGTSKFTASQKFPLIICVIGAIIGLVIGIIFYSISIFIPIISTIIGWIFGARAMRRIESNYWRSAKFS